jgi:hypothetical protein
MSSAEHARAILRMTRGPRRGPTSETAPVACNWCAAGPGQPCRGIGTDRPLTRIHAVRAETAARRDETTDLEGGAP